MNSAKVKVQRQVVSGYYIRKLAKSGNSRYIAVTNILPRDWEAVKVYVEQLSSEDALLRIVPIR